MVERTMTFDDHFRDQISRGQPPLIALHNAAQAYAASMKPRDCAQYADETAAWSEPQDGNETASWRLLKKGEIIQLGDETDRCANPWKDDAKWEPVSELSVGQEAPDPSYPSHRIFRRRVQSVISKPQDSEAVELLREGDRLMASRTTWTSAEMLWHDRVRNFLEGK